MGKTKEDEIKDAMLSAYNKIFQEKIAEKQRVSQLFKKKSKVKIKEQKKEKQKLEQARKKDKRLVVIGGIAFAAALGVMVVGALGAIVLGPLILGAAGITGVSGIITATVGGIKAKKKKEELVTLTKKLTDTEHFKEMLIDKNMFITSPDQSKVKTDQSQSRRRLNQDQSKVNKGKEMQYRDTILVIGKDRKQYNELLKEINKNIAPVILQHLQNQESLKTYLKTLEGQKGLQEKYSEFIKKIKSIKQQMEFSTRDTIDKQKKTILEQYNKLDNNLKESLEAQAKSHGYSLW